MIFEHGQTIQYVSFRLEGIPTPSPVLKYNQLVVQTSRFPSPQVASLFLSSRKAIMPASPSIIQLSAQWPDPWWNYRAKTNPL